MEVAESGSSSRRYSFGPPWSFKGSALYQLHLVRSETARAFIPKELKLVEAFGYTLGGFFLAQYEDSPAGTFDELVVISGIVWNPPTSCAWAARVLVNNQEACTHGRKEIGLPSHVAIFSENSTRCLDKPGSKPKGILNMLGISSTSCNLNIHSEIKVSEINGSIARDLCNISLPFNVSGPKLDKKLMGPTIKMSLPSFSGKTEYNPNLLKYSCQIECRVQKVKPAKISGPNKVGFSDKHESLFSGVDGSSTESDMWNRCISVLLSKPILALRFNFLKMQVQAPALVVTLPKKNALRGSTA